MAVYQCVYILFICLCFCAYMYYELCSALLKQHEAWFMTFYMAVKPIFSTFGQFL